MSATCAYVLIVPNVSIYAQVEYLRLLELKFQPSDAACMASELGRVGVVLAPLTVAIALI